jgi:ubiquinone/menaquinone biosynthesis C-methylase UbiE
VHQSDPAVRFFDTTARDYESRHYGEAVRSFMTVRQERVLEFVDSLGLPPGARVLDAGCGPGYLLDALARRGFRVCGLDAADGMLHCARTRLGGAAAGFSQGSIEHLPFADGVFDLVCSTGVIEYLERDTVALAEMTRVLRSGGHLIVPVTNRWSPINWFDFLIESLKRRETFRRSFNAVWTRFGRQPVLPRHFKVRQHGPAEFRASLHQAGIRLVDDVYFHFLPWPHPLDQFFPRATAVIGSKMERLGKSWLGPMAEGYLVRAVKQDVAPATVVIRHRRDVRSAVTTGRSDREDAGRFLSRIFHRS